MSRLSKIGSIYLRYIKPYQNDHQPILHISLNVFHQRKYSFFYICL